MSKIAFSLDWLRCTFVWDGKMDPSEVVGIHIGARTERKGKGSYNSGYECDFCGVYWHSEHPENKVMLEMTGVNLSDYRTRGNSEVSLIRLLLRAGGNFTRVDFAVDIFDSGGLPVDMLYCWESSQVSTVAKSVLSIERKSTEKSMGQTVYFGSRTSERLVRIYDKGKQKKTKLDWLRVELEAKGLRANQLASMLVEAGIKLGGLRMLADVIDWTDVGWFNSVFDDDYEIFDIDKIGRPVTDRDKWLRTVVVPVVEAELAAGNHDLYERLAAAILRYEDGNSHGPRLTK